MAGRDVKLLIDELRESGLDVWRRSRSASESGGFACETPGRGGVTIPRFFRSPRRAGRIIAAPKTTADKAASPTGASRKTNMAAPNRSPATAAFTRPSRHILRLGRAPLSSRSWRNIVFPSVQSAQWISERASTGTGIGLLLGERRTQTSPFIGTKARYQVRRMSSVQATLPPYEQRFLKQGR